MENSTSITNTNPNFNYDLQVSTSDLVNVGVNKVETHLKKVIQHFTSANEVIDKQVAVIRKSLVKAEEKFGAGRIPKVIQTLKEAMKATKGTKIEVRVKAATHKVYNKKTDKSMDKVQVTVSLINPSERQTVVVHKEDAAPNAAIKKLIKSIEDAEATRAGNTAKSAMAQKELFNMGDHQRTISARITQQQLAKTKEGQAMIGDMDNFLKNLGLDDLPQIGK